MISYW